MAKTYPGTLSRFTYSLFASDRWRFTSCCPSDRCAPCRSGRSGLVSDLLCRVLHGVKSTVTIHYGKSLARWNNSKRQGILSTIASFWPFGTAKLGRPQKKKKMSTDLSKNEYTQNWNTFRASHLFKSPNTPPFKKKTKKNLEPNFQLWRARQGASFVSTIAALCVANKTCGNGKNTRKHQHYRSHYPNSDDKRPALDAISDRIFFPKHTNRVWQGNTFTTASICVVRCSGFRNYARLT